MAEQSQPTAMVMLASEQLWPNIHGLVHWHKHGHGLDHVCIYHTGDETKSEQPARRLKRFCEQLDPKLDGRVHLPNGEVGIQPKLVVDQISRWQEQIRSFQTQRGLSDCRWIINASGGNKPMFAGLLEFAGQDSIQVVYRELRGPWFQVKRTDDGSIQFEEFPDEVRSDEMDDVPVEELLRAQWEPSEESRYDPQPPIPFDIALLTRLGVESNWNWKNVFRDVGYQNWQKEPLGVLFERYVAAGLLTMGISPKNLRVNVTLGSGRQLWQENDVIANFGGRLLIFDCKLTTRDDIQTREAEKLSHQIEIAADRRDRLGGRSAESVLLRPGILFSEDDHALARAYDLKVVDRDAAWHMFQRLAAFVGIDMPPSLKAVESSIRKARSPREEYVFARPPRADAVLDLDAWLKNQKRNQDWFAYKLWNKIHVVLRNRKRDEKKLLQQSLSHMLQDFGGIKDDACAFRLPRLRGEKSNQLYEYLAQFLGRPLPVEKSTDSHSS